MQPHTLTNPFEVPLGQEEQFLEAWREAAEYLRHSPGFLSTRLHQSLDPGATFRFANIAEWETAQHFQCTLKGERIKVNSTDVVTRSRSGPLSALS